MYISKYNIKFNKKIKICPKYIKPLGVYTFLGGIKLRLNKDEVKELYVRGYNAKEIANILKNRGQINIKSDTVQRCINRNFYKLKSEHKKNRDINKDIKKSIDNMNNSFMSNSSLLKMNRQRYNYNKNGNLVFDESIGKRPYDLPKTYYIRNNN